MSQKMLSVLGGTAATIPPVWFMRQAGRYLPEYQAARARAGSFLDLCFNPALAAEVTLQPVERFDLDAAILFSDILIIPHALGQALSFVAGDGPRLHPATTAKELDGYRQSYRPEALAPIFETVRRVRAQLATDKTLIGFAGAPWTVATYMLAGGRNDDPAAWRASFYDDAGFVDELFDLLIDATVDYLVGQVDAGADVLQLFDSWAGGLPASLTQKLSIEPMRIIAARVRAARPETPFIFFPKGVGQMLRAYAELRECDCISIDYTPPYEPIRREVATHAAVQGGLDPLLVVKGGDAMLTAAGSLLRAFDGAPYVFNVGHGLVPQTPPQHVADLVRFVRSGEWKASNA